MQDPCLVELEKLPLVRSKDFASFLGALLPNSWKECNLGLTCMTEQLYF